MPTYDYQCVKCDKVEEVIHKMLENPMMTCECGFPMEKKFTPNRVGFTIKGGTPTMDWKETRNRMKKREEVGNRQKSRWKSGPRVTPNIAGVEQESWSDCQKLAKECGLNHDSYTPKVEKEKKEKGPKIYTGPAISS